MKNTYILFSIFLLIYIIGCVTTDLPDPARFIIRNCPIKRVYDDEASQTVLKGHKWTGGKVNVIGECYHDSLIIASWAKSNNIPCVILSGTAVRRKSIPNGHRTVYPIGSKYVVDYVDYQGLVKTRKSLLEINE